jgi:hypothetical protein
MVPLLTRREQVDISDSNDFAFRQPLRAVVWVEVAGHKCLTRMTRGPSSFWPGRARGNDVSTVWSVHSSLSCFTDRGVSPRRMV